MNWARTRNSRGARDRELQLDKCIAAADLQIGPRRIDAPTRSHTSFTQLRQVIEEMGGGFALFGPYLASRADLLRISDCLVLAEKQARSPQSAFDDIVERIESALGGRLEDHFSQFAPVPTESSPAYQVHEATTRIGDRVEVLVIHPGLEEQLEEDLALLPKLLSSIPDQTTSLEDSLAGFQQDARAQLDLGHTARCLSILEHSGDSVEGLKIPRVLPEHSASTILTLERLETLPLNAPGSRHGGPLARRITGIWLNLALAGRFTIVQGRFERTEDDQMVLTRGHFAPAHGATQQNLWNYLQAAAGHRSDLAFECLTYQLGTNPAMPPMQLFEKRLRQAVPPHDGSITVGGESLVEHLLMHWSLIRECKLSAPSSLIQFYRGVFWCALETRELATGVGWNDPFLDAVHDRRMSTDWNRFEQFCDPARFAQAIEGYMGSFSTLPQSLDRLFDSQSMTGRVPPSDPSNPSGATSRLALGFAMLSLVMIAPQLRQFFPQEAADSLMAVIFLLLGVLFLRATRSKP